MRETNDQIPRRHFWLGRILGKLLLRLLRWRIRGELPQLKKALLVVAPHTSNWDWVIGMAAALALDLDASWLGKHTLFAGPFRRALLWLGGIPVNRSSPEGVIEQVVVACNSRERFLFAIAPEGTRKPVAQWKTGCCRIAAGTGLPLVPIALDYAHREVVIFAPCQPSGKLDQDMQRLSNYFQQEMAKFPERFLAYQPVAQRRSGVPGAE